MAGEVFGIGNTEKLLEIPFFRAEICLVKY